MNLREPEEYPVKTEGGQVLIYESRYARAWLSCSHSASSYGIPVLVIKVDVGKNAGQEELVCGPADLLPSGLTGYELVHRLLEADRLRGEAADLARKFLACCPPA